MNAVSTHVAGVDVHKEVFAICVLRGPATAEPEEIQFTCETFTEDLEKAGRKLIELGVTDVAMESTGVYWRPAVRIWSSMGLRCCLANAGHIKNVPGRKTDSKDCHWIAMLHRMGLIKASFVPSAEFQELRAITRHRDNLVQDASAVKNRVHKVLEDGNVKLASVVSDPFGKAGMGIMEALAQGHDDTQSVLESAQIPRRKWEHFRKAVFHRLDSSHRFLLQELLIQFKQIQERIARAEQEINRRTERHEEILQRLDEIPGIDRTLAQGILAEATTETKNFSNDRAFAAWAGVAPGNNESGGKKKEPERDTETPRSRSS